jgi:dihydrofolate reductase
MKFFRNVTMGKPIVMGRRTFGSLPRVLDGRLNVVLTRDPSFSVPEVVRVSSLDAGLEAARTWAGAQGADEIAVIGGEGVFRAAMPLADRIYLTEVHAVPEADTWFPELDQDAWREVSRDAFQAGPKDDHDFSIAILERV